MRVFLSEKAKSDLLRIYRYIAERNSKAADALIQGIGSNLDNLARFPFIGRERSSLAPGVRCLVVGLYLVFYIVAPDRITVARIIDGCMDVDEEFHR